MTEAIFGRKTRSQIALPDDILQIPDRSPLKDARTALRNQAAATRDACSPPKASDDTDDELLLSPRKTEPSMKSATNSKRSASPPAQDEYSHRSSSPSDGRELKRAKRDTESIERRNESRVNGGEGQDFQGETTKHTRNSSEPIIHIGRRTGRRRSATTTKKTLSTVSASPPPTLFSPPTTSPSKTRAQSVPVFPESFDIPRIDFRNLPLSPKRSRSRSPSKDAGPQLRIGPTKFSASSTLPTIQDEISSNTTSYEGSNDAGNTETVTEVTTVDTSQIVITAIAEETPALPPTPMTSASKSMHLQIPATPAIESLNKLIPMSPLTPVPETPLPTKFIPSARGTNFYTNTLGRKQSSLVPIDERAGSSQSHMPPPPPPSELKSRLPRPSQGINLKTEQSTAQTTPMVASIHRGPNTDNLPSKGQEGKSGTSGTNVFDMLMNASRDVSMRQRVEKERAVTGRISKLQPPTQAMSIFGSSSKAEMPVAGSSKAKQMMRQRMKPNTKPKPVQPLLYVGTSDDEEEQEEANKEESAFVASSLNENETEAPVVETRRQSTPPSSSRRLASDIPMEVVEDSQDEEILLEDKGVDSEFINSDKKEQVGVSALSQREDPDVSMLSITANEIPFESKVVPEQGSQDQPESIQHGDVSMDSPTKGSLESSIETKGTGADEAPTIQATPELSTSEFAIARPSETEEVQSTAPQAEVPAKAQKSKMFFGKKKEPTTTIAFGGRVTRSVSNQKNHSVAGSSIPGPSHARPTIATTAKRTAQSAPRKTVNNIAASQDAPSKQKLLPGSPMKISSPAKASTVKTPTKGVGTFTLPNKSISTPSPTKIARLSTVLSKKPSSATAITFSMDTSQVSMGASSSLSTLSNALEKLRMPAPSRPSTSMGFNRDIPDEEEATRSKDDAALGRTSIGMRLPKGGLKRASTLGADAFKPSTTGKATATSSKGPEKNLVQPPISAFMLNRGGARKSGASSRGTVKTSIMGKPIFGIGGAPRRLLSKKSALPTVIGSPVKGGGDADPTMREFEEDEEREDTKTQPDTDDNFMAPTSLDATAAQSLDDSLVHGNSDKGKEKETETSTTSRSSNGSRRVSMVSHALSQSLNAIPPPRGLMGPPATPPNRSNRSSSSTYPSTSGGGSSPSSGPSVATRASARIAKTAPGALMKIKGGTDGHVSSQRKGVPEPTPVVNPAVEALKVLKDCTIFVDVKTDDGDEAGSLFVEMLEGVGARVLTRVGQTCTHIVFKNGLMSTITRYRLLRDPKPFVVGIAWVVECVEQRKHVDESEFLVDIEHSNVAGVNKRRRSILPRMFVSEIEATSSEADKDEIEADRSMDGSVSSITMDDELAPLERARRRKSLMPAGAKA